MRTILKGAEPASLTQHRQTPHSDYENYADKDTLRNFLAAEQRGLCCYCLSRIRPAIQAMKIEHWHSQKKYSDEQLVYANILGACLGSENRAYKFQHCDMRKGKQDLSRNPANPEHQVENFVHFEGDGTITSHDQDFEKELNEILNLNSPFLKSNRKAVLEAFKSALNKRGELQRSTLEKWLQDWNGESHAQELQPYCQVIVYWLRKRLARS